MRCHVNCQVYRNILTLDLFFFALIIDFIMMHLISILLIATLSISLIHGTLATPVPPSGSTEQSHRSSISSSRSGLSDQERLADLERRTHDLLLRNDQFSRHNSFDYVTSEPGSQMRYGGSYLSLPDLNQANAVIEPQHYDWLTPRAEAQVNEFFPLMSAVVDPMTSSGTSSQYSPHSTSPIDHVPQQRRMSMTPRQQQGIPPPPPSRPHVCDQCNTGFMTKQELRHHSIEHHIDNEERITYTCPVCDTEFLGRTTLINAHLPTHYKHDTTYQDIRLRLG